MPRKPMKKRGSTPLPGKKQANRLADVAAGINGTESADDIMDKVAAALNDTQVSEPMVGNYYAFAYLAAKKGLLTDLYPIVAVTGVFPWGFTGINMHLGEQRNYNYPLLVTPMYQVKASELDTARTLPLMMLVKNPG